ncbi:hypothetical protein B0H21DRAFT_62463 [Amylocystis lapponica]|nr:hypothetical protein B0H21DRAFT_62463 [Amylocystis lapponica]
MKYLTSAFVLASLVQLSYQVTVNTVSGITECEPIQFTWSGGVPPYYLELLPAEQTSAPAMKQFPQTSSTSFTWLVDLEANTSFTIAVTDSNGAQGYSSIETINAGTSTSCLNTAVTDSGAAGSTSGGGSSTGAASPTSTSPSGTSSSSGCWRRSLLSCRWLLSLILTRLLFALHHDMIRNRGLLVYGALR